MSKKDETYYCDFCNRMLMEGLIFETFRMSFSEGLIRIGDKDYPNAKHICVHCLHIVALAAKRH